MKDEDSDEDFYEETTSKIIYKKRSSASRPTLKESEEEGVGSSAAERTGRSINEKTTANEREQYTSSKRTELQSDGSDKMTAAETPEDASGREETHPYTTRKMRTDDQKHGYRGKKDEFEDSTMKTQTTKFGRLKDITELATKGPYIHESWSDSAVHAPDRVKDEMKDWSERARQAVQRKPKAFLGRPDIRGEVVTEGQSYYAVTKWKVDYTNKNFVRSKCHKPRGFHRYVIGRPYDWDISYDNRYYLRSKVNAPKGLHRRGQDVKRKRVPDKDILADSTGWEFEYGPEFNQVEGDVPFYRQEKIIGKGGYRFYGVRRNNSDTDQKIEERPIEIKGLLSEELKYGAEFLQDDIPHMIKQKERRIGRGGYRYPDVKRNACDIHPKDPIGVDYRTSRASIDMSFIEEDDDAKPKGKPFKRTLLKKTYKLEKPPSIEKFTHGTLLTFVPGEGSKTFYEGKSSRPSILEIKKHPSIRSVFKSKKKTYSYERHTPTKFSSFKDSDSDLRRRESWKTDTPIRRPSSPKRHFFDEYRYQKQRDERRRSYEDVKRKDFQTKRIRGRFQEDTDERHEFPPEVRTRIEEIKGRISREVPARSTGLPQDQFIKRKGYHKIEEADEDDEIDWRSHQDHSHDHGKSVVEGYEKYVNENGSEIWIKTEKKYSKLHHKKSH